MELIEGSTLREVLADHRLDERQVFSLMDQLLDAVGYAHEHGVTHRDLKPDNVFLTLDGRVKLADFGIAHIDSETLLTQVGAVVGTPAYMAPEQILGERIDPRCDVFALGTIAYEALTGENPFGSSSSTHYATLVHRIVNKPYRRRPPFPRMRPEWPASSCERSRSTARIALRMLWLCDPLGGQQAPPRHQGTYPR